MLLPMLLVISLISTFCEALRYLFCLNKYVVAFEDGNDEQVTLVLPAVATYIFWQAGMVHYLCEHFDTRRAKIVAVSSGAVCTMALLAFEAAALKGNCELSKRQRIRQRATEIFRETENATTHLLTSPIGFVARLGTALDGVLRNMLPEEFDANALGDRVRIGIRRLEGCFPPALMPDVISEFSTKTELLNATAISSHLGLIVRPFPVAYLESKKAWCCDGVNVYSFYYAFEYVSQLWFGIASRAAPAKIMNGLDTVYALLNCGVIRMMLPRRGKTLWVTPALGNKLRTRFALRVSGYWTARQWQHGYAHAKELHAQGHWNLLPQWTEEDCEANHEQSLWAAHVDEDFDAVYI